ncbi:hypothetical protein AB0L26_07450 [Streptomyces nondiastaticus]|uniref:hypothetical protein n=1 Tax=Streptomyces nondiastaticus TaxID=3154512 RepID=UPI0034485F97
MAMLFASADTDQPTLSPASRPPDAAEQSAKDAQASADKAKQAATARTAARSANYSANRAVDAARRAVASANSAQASAASARASAEGSQGPRERFQPEAVHDHGVGVDDALAHEFHGPAEAVHDDHGSHDGDLVVVGAERRDARGRRGGRDAELLERTTAP